MNRYRWTTPDGTFICWRFRTRILFCNTTNGIMGRMEPRPRNAPGVDTMEWVASQYRDKQFTQLTEREMREELGRPNDRIVRAY